MQLNQEKKQSPPQQFPIVSFRKAKEKEEERYFVKNGKQLIGLTKCPKI